MAYEFEYQSYDDADEIATLENMPNPGAGDGSGTATAGIPQFAGVSSGTYAFPRVTGPNVTGPNAFSAFQGGSGSFPSAAGAPDGRTEALINHGRQRAKRARAGWMRRHWRAVTVAVALASVAFGIVMMALPGGSASWPASVARVQTEITQACQNPNVAAEPSALNFACAKDTQAILWVFALLTSGDNPSFVDRATGRKGLEPILPSQGGDIAYSLNLHHPYNPANPIDSLQVAARAINNIISGGTLTSTSGAPIVQGGLESSPANCQRYTGSSVVVSKQGYPARCALAVSTPFGQAALVSDTFQEWMGGTLSQFASEAGVLFENVNDPGNPQVQAILASLHQT